MLNKKYLPSSLKNKSKISIKSLSVKSEDPIQLYEEKWPILKQCIESVFQERKSDQNFEVLYRYVGEICRKHQEQSLYIDIRSMFVDHVKEIRSSLEKCLNHSNTMFLRNIVDVWTRFEQHVLTIRNIFLILDRNYILQLNGPIKSIWDMGMDLFRSSVIQVYSIQSNLITQLLDLLQTEREGEAIESHLLTSCLSMFSNLHVYETIFQEPLLQQSVQYYKNEASSRFEAIQNETTLNTETGLDVNVETIEPYLQWVRRKISQEEYFANHYFLPMTKFPLLSALYKELVDNYAVPLLNLGFEPLMIQKKELYLKELYTLLQTVDKLDLLKEHFYRFIVSKGSLIVKDSQRDETMVQDLLHFHKEILDIHKNCFQKSVYLQQAIKDGCIEFINSRPRKPAEMIAKFLNKHLQKGNKGYSELDIEGVMDDAMTIFKFVREIDVFEAFYKKDLAKRLLLDRSISTDIEKTMLSKLKEECGGEFTRKLEGMFKDVESNINLMQDFSSSEEMSKCETPFHVQIITSGNWPPYQSCAINLPRDLIKNQKVYEQFYLKKFSGRKLQWQNQLGRCSIIGRFPISGEKVLDVSLFQASVLLLYNKSDSFTFSKISEELQTDENELKLTLKSLTISKQSPLRKDVDDIDSQTSFSFNKEFQTPKMKIRINALQAAETKKENEDTSEKILVERIYVIDAAVVRVMKARKELNHQELLATIMKMLNFPATFQDIKKRIDSLIERDYLTRDPDDLTKIIYCS